MALTTVSSDRLSTNVKNTNFTAAEKQDLTDDIKPLLGSSGGGNKNLIINGAMQVAQRGTSSTTSGYGSVDRFRVVYSGTDEAPTQAQVDVGSSDLPFTKGLTKALKVTNGNQTSGAGAADFIQIQQRIESQNVRNSGWNYTSTSSNITLSFYVRASVTQTYFGIVQNNDAGYNYPFSFALTANTWTKVTKTIPGNSNLNFNNDTGLGIDLRFIQFYGTNYTDNAATVNNWVANTGANEGPDQTSTWYTTDDATFELTGVQLEVGSVATEFEHKPFSLEERLCQRYYFRQSAEHQYMRYACHGQTPSANGAQYVYPLPVRMRAVPTLGYSALGDFYMYAGNLQSKTPTSLAMDAQSTISPMFVGAKSSTFTGGQMAHLTTPNANQGYLEFIAEL